MFHYSMLLAGPTITFKDYMDFIEGKDVDPNQNKEKVNSNLHPFLVMHPGIRINELLLTSFLILDTRSVEKTMVVCQIIQICRLTQMCTN